MHSTWTPCMVMLQNSKNEVAHLPLSMHAASAWNTSADLQLGFPEHQLSKETRPREHSCWHRSPANPEHSSWSLWGQAGGSVAQHILPFCFLTDKASKGPSFFLWLVNPLRYICQWQGRVSWGVRKTCLSYRLGVLWDSVHHVHRASVELNVIHVCHQHSP